MQKNLVPGKKLACADSARTTNWMVWYKKKLASCKMHCLT
jgi:hypothetical protein